MLPDQAQAREAAAWQAFVKSLSAQLAVAWPAMQERLAARYEAFIEHAVQQALQLGIRHAAGVARFVNLCVVWGPSFQERAGFEWAKDLLARTRGHEWLSVHQLVRRSVVELDARPDARIGAPALEAVDVQLIEQFASMGREGAMLTDNEAPALPLVACDLEAAELRVLDPEALLMYRLDAAEWHRVPAPVPAPLRTGPAHPGPARVNVLTPPMGQGPPAKLQARLRAHAVCDGAHHPALGFAGPHGLWTWRGHETRAVSWPVTTLAQAEPPAGPGTAIAEETTPEIHRLDLEVCGLRDEGEALGGASLQVWAWPSTQWWIEIHRQAPTAQRVGHGSDGIAKGTTRCRVEADGLPRHVGGLEQGLARDLDGACGQALHRLRAAWEAVPAIAQPVLEGTLGLLIGQAAFTWGWHLGPQGVAGRALMRVQGRIDMAACRVDLQFSGDIERAGGRARVQIKVAGDAPMKHAVQREGDEAPLLATVMPLVTRFSLPIDVSIDPLASETGCLLQAAGPATGALVGEAGLRPRTSGGSGWEWFAAVRLDSVALPVSATDPFLGQSVHVLELLPAQALIDWKLG